MEAWFLPSIRRLQAHTRWFSLVWTSDVILLPGVVVGAGMECEFAEGFQGTWRPLAFLELCCSYAMIRRKHLKSIEDAWDERESEPKFLLGSWTREIAMPGTAPGSVSTPLSILSKLFWVATSVSHSKTRPDWIVWWKMHQSWSPSTLKIRSQVYHASL